MKKEHIITIAPSILHKLFNSSCLSIHIQTCHFRLRIEASIKTYFRYRFLERIRTAVATLQFKAQNAEDSELTEQEKELLAQAAGFEAKFDQAMDDDFNTADAIAAIFELVKFANTCGDTEHTKAFWEALKEKITTLSDVCGLIVEKKEELLDNVTIGGVATYMDRAEEANVNLFI